MSEAERLREILAQIASLASKAAGKKLDHNSDPEYGEKGAVPVDVPGCSVKALPKRLLQKAASTAMRINPVNAPLAAPVGAGADFGVMDPMHLAVLTAKYWGPKPRELTVSFTESCPGDLRRKILSHMNAWTKTGCVSFVETSGTGQVRITRDQAGYWSYLGTDVLHIPKNRPTMCLQAFSMKTPDAEFYRVVRHETGHTLGFPHEHMRKELIDRIDRKKAYQHFLIHQSWDKAMVDAQVLTPLDERSIMGTPSDQTSIMCYQLPASITKDNKPIVGGRDINSTDYAFAGRIYPKRGTTPESAPVADLLGHTDSENGEESWDESEDPDVE